MLTQKENAMRVLLRDREPEWVPVASDCLQLIIPSALLERPKTRIHGETGTDWFGCRWIFDAPTRGYAQLFDNGPILTDVAQWDKTVNFPDLNTIDWQASAEKDAALRNPSKVSMIFWESGPFERSHHLLGFENVFYAMYDDPEAYQDLLNALTDWRIAAMEKVIDAYQPDMILTHDDLGAMSSPLMSLDMYREFIKPCHKRILSFIRSKGVIAGHHSCGKMDVFVGDLIECGAQVLNSFQGVNDQEGILAKYGSKFSVYGGVHPMVERETTTAEEIRAEVRRTIDTFAPYRNLLFADNSIRDDVHMLLHDEACRYGSDYRKLPDHA